MNEAQRLWDECAGILQAQVSEPVWLTSFEAARASGFEGGVLTLAVPSFLAKERIEGRYLSLVRDALTEIGAADVELALEIAPREPEPPGPSPRPTAAAPVPAADDDGVLLQDINPRYTFDTFVIGPSNRFAHAAALAVAETPARKYNPLFIYGDAGLGKTHLLQAIGHYVRENYPTYRVRYVTSETFLNEFIDAVRNEHQRRLQAPLPGHRRAADRRHPVHRGQDGDPGGVLPHLQPPPPGQPPDRPLLGSAARTPSAPWRTGCAAASRWG